MILDYRNRPPSADLAPYIRQLFVIRATMGDERPVNDWLYAHTAFVRVVVKNESAAAVRTPKPHESEDPVILGCSLHGFPIRTGGTHASVGFAIRPGAWRVLFDADARTLVDAAQPLVAHWDQIAVDMKQRLASVDDDDGFVAVLEDAIRARLAQRDLRLVDTKIDLFENIMRLQSMARVDDVAARLGLSARQFERRCLATFGLPPKVIMRRSRFLDMAAAMKGYSAPGEEQLAALRYFDMSHRNREFRKFIGMTPGRFLKESAPMMNLGLAFREKGKQMV